MVSSLHFLAFISPPNDPNDQNAISGLSFRWSMKLWVERKKGCLDMSTCVSSRMPDLCSVQRSQQYSLSMVESWRKVIPGLSMIKLTPHRVSQIRFCALDTVAAAYSMLSRIQSHLSFWHHCIAITVSEMKNRLGPWCAKRINETLSLSVNPLLSFSFCPWFQWALILIWEILLLKSWSFCLVWCKKKQIFANIKCWKNPSNMQFMKC